MVLNHLELYTDGGAIKVGKKYYGSSAFVIRYGNQYYVSSNPVQPGTNNFYELKAMRDGLQTIVNTYKVKHIEIWVISDSQYSISCITEWCKDWTRHGKGYYNKQGKKIENIDLLTEIWDLLAQLPHYRFIKIKSHISLDIDPTYEEFKRKNKLDVTREEYLLMVRYNETCDQTITHAFNLRRKALAEKMGVAFI